MSLEYMYLISLDASATQLQGGSWVQFGPVRSSQVQSGPVRSQSTQSFKPLSLYLYDEARLV